MVLSNGGESLSDSSEEKAVGFNCPDAAKVVTPELVRALDELCTLARDMGRQDMAKQCADWAKQLRAVLDMDAESQKKVLSDIWLG